MYIHICPWLLGGDINMCMNANDKKIGQKYDASHKRSRTQLKSKIREFKLADIFI